MIVGSWRPRDPGSALDWCRYTRGTHDSNGGLVSDPSSGLWMGHGGRLLQTMPSVVEPSDILLVGDFTLFDRGRLRAVLGIDQDADDYALICHAYRRWGADCFAHVNGDFAIALWDTKRQLLVLARDIAGMRPLHYRMTADGIDFASMASPLANADDQRATPDYRRLLRYVSLLPQTGRDSFFAEVDRVEPGATILFDATGVRRLESWAPPPQDSHIGFEDAVSAMRDAIDAAVGDRMQVASGPVSIQLSAGMDSSAVFASAARQSKEPIYAFTGAPIAGSVRPMSENRFADESVIAARTAALYPSAVHERVESSLEPTLAFADRWARLIEQPLRSYGNLGWTEATLAGAARRGSGHILTGAFGNMSFSYDGFAAIPEALTHGQWKNWAQLTAGVRRQPGVRWRGALARSLPALLSPPQSQSLLKWFGKERDVDGFADTYLNLRHPLVAELCRSALDQDASLGPTRSGRAERLRAMHWVDEGCYVHGAAVGWGVQQLDPTADRRVIDLCFRLPTRLFIHGGCPRSLAIEVLRGTVDDEVLAPRKGVQGQDWHISFGKSVADMRDEVRRLHDHTELAGMIQLDRLDETLLSWQQDPDAGSRDFRRFELLSRTLLAARWARRIIDGETASNAR